MIRRFLSATALALILLGALWPSQQGAAVSDDTPTLWRTIPTAGNPMAVAVNPDTGRVYTAHVTQDVNVFDSASGQLLTTLHELGAVMDINRSTNRLYVAGYFYGTVSVVDLASNTVVTKIPVPAYPTSIAVDSAANRIYVNANEATISVIDGNTNTVVDHIDEGGWSLTVDSVNRRLYMFSYTGDSPQLAAIDMASGQRLGEVTVDPEALGIGVDPTSGTVFVPATAGDSTANGSLWIVDGPSMTVTKTVQVDGQGSAVAVNSHTHRVYVAQFYEDSVAVFDFSGGRLATVALGTGSSPGDIAVDEVHDLVYTADSNASQVSVIGNGPAPATAPPLPSVTPVGFGRGGGPPASGAGSPLAAFVVAIALLALGASLVLAARRSR